MSKQLKLKQSGDSERFNILKYEQNSDMWCTVLEIERDDVNHGYKIKSEDQTFIVYDKSEHVSKTEQVLGSDLRENGNRVVRKRAYHFFESILKGTSWQSNFENKGVTYSIGSLPSGTKGTLYPVNKNEVPIAVFSQSTIKINGQFQLELSVADWATDEDISHILLFYTAEYIANQNLSEVVLLSVHMTLFYAFNNRKILTKEHIYMLSLEKRPTKFEAFSWYYVSIPLIYFFLAIKVMRHSLKQLISVLSFIAMIYLLIFGIVVLIKHTRSSK